MGLSSLLFAGIGFEAVIEIGGTVSRHHLFEIGLVHAFALLDLLGATYLGCLPIRRRNGRGIDQLLAKAGAVRNIEIDATRMMKINSTSGTRGCHQLVICLRQTAAAFACHR